MEDYEKLGAFYLGKSFDLKANRSNDDLILYDSKDLTTHAVIIGMTGSGKTGLGISLIEEAAIDKIPVIAIDPKGDLGNCLLNFPELAADDFKPWVDPREAARKGMSADDYAADQAMTWEKGLAQWDQDKSRIKRLADSVDMAIYTPGSNAGIPISVLKSFDAPPAIVREDSDLYRERIQSTATSILALLGIDADPLTSREHILLSNILKHAFDSDKNLDIATLITEIQNPPLERIGVVDLDSFFPPKDRFALAMRLNNLLAAPGFDVWMRGVSLSAESLFHTTDGKPRLSVMSIAHLADSERMFFVTMLLNEIVSWMRRQPGTGSLRAILYMDEIFGYMPPSANPPTKMLFLTLLKQARAYGLGLVLATQNPVDLDYKGLSNTGTWFIGRLQTERDKARVMEGLEGAAAGGEFDRSRMEQILAGLGKRRFLLHNVHDNAPVVFSTRWVLSYLAGPLTRDQIKMLMADRKTIEESAAAQDETKPVKAPPASSGSASSKPPVLPPKLRQYFLPLTTSPEDGDTVVYYPKLIGAATVPYQSARYKINSERNIVCLTEFDDGPVGIDWSESEPAEVAVTDLDKKGRDGAEYAPLPALASKATSYTKWERNFKRWVRTDCALTVFYSPTYKLVSEPEETEGAFRVRLQQAAHEVRDINVGKLRTRYESKLNTLENRLQRARQKVATESEQSSQSKLDTAVSFGTAILGAFLGRGRSRTTGVGGAIKKAGRMQKQSADVERAEAIAKSVQEDIDALNLSFDEDVAKLEETFDAQNESLEERVIRAKSTDIQIQVVSLAWAPVIRSSDGSSVSAWG